MYEYPIGFVQTDFVDLATAPVINPVQRISVQRSSSGLNNGSTVDRAECGLDEFYVAVGGVESSRHLAASVHPAIAWNLGTRMCFAPSAGQVALAGVAPESLTIRWRLRNPLLITQASLYLYRIGEANPIWTQALEWSNGTLVPTGGVVVPNPVRVTDGNMVWDGTIPVQNPHFPTGSVNAANSPYKLKMVITPSGGTDCRNIEAWTYFDVRVQKITLGWFADLDYPNVLPPTLAARDGVVYGKLVDLADADNLNGVFPLAGGEKRVYLEGNVFYKASPELEDNTYYNRWRAKWGDGPNIPILATIHLRNSAGQPVLAPWAVGNMKLFWDWVDKARDWVNAAGVEPTLPQNDANIRDFLDASQDYKAAATADAPAGKNCHVERGGKRGPGAAPVFPNQNGIAPVPALLAPVGAADNAVFPFQVVNNSGQLARKWTAFSSTWATGQFMGQSGVLFQPSRMAGDGYELHVFPAAGTDAAVLANADSSENPLSSFHTKTGVFRTWRWIDVPAYLRAGPGSPDNSSDALSLDTLQAAFKGAYTYLNRRNVAPRNVTTPFRIKLVEVAQNLHGNGANVDDFVRYAVDLSGASNGLIEFVDRDVWINKVLNDRFAGNALAMTTWADAYAGIPDANGAPIHQSWRQGPTHPLVYQWPVNVVENVNAQDHLVTMTVNANTASAPGPVGPAGAAMAAQVLNIRFAKNTSNVVQADITAMDPVVQTVFDHVFANAPQQGITRYPFNYRGLPDPPVVLTLAGKDRNTSQRHADRLTLVANAFKEKWNAKVMEQSKSLYPTATGRAWIYLILDEVINKVLAGSNLAPLPVPPGITILHLNDLTKKVANCNLPTGKAMFANAAGNIIRPMVLANPPAIQTMVHELGHCVFLNHTFQSEILHDRMEFSQDPGPGNSAVMHKTPSTATGPTASIDGFDMFRIRGWSIYQTDAAGLEIPPPVGLRVLRAVNPANGVVNIVGNGGGRSDVQYTPNMGYTGPDTLTLICGDGNGFEAPVTLRVGVLAPVLGRGGSMARGGIKAYGGVLLTFDPFDPARSHPDGDPFVTIRGKRAIWKQGTANRKPGGTPPPAYHRDWESRTGASCPTV